MKKIIVALLMAVLVFALAACSINKQEESATKASSDGQTNSETVTEGEAPDASINITNLSEEKVEMTEKLQQVSYSEGEEQVNPFYKKGMNEENSACYVVRFAGQNTETNIPMDNTVIYSTDTGESYIEKVSFSYEIEGETTDVEQYRLYINTAQE